MSKRTTRIIGMACGLSLLTGCTTLNAGVDPAKLGVGGSGYPLGPDVLTSAETADAEALMDARWVQWDVAVRGRAFATAMMGESDLRCDRYLTAVSVDRNVTRGTLDVVGLTLGAIGGVASPNASANWFSAGSTLAQSSRRSLEDTVLGGHEFGLIYSAVWSGRDEARRGLEARIAKGEFDNWDWRPILSLVRQYDLKCGLNYGLGRLSQAVAQQSGGQF